MLEFFSLIICILVSFIWNYTFFGCQIPFIKYSYVLVAGSEIERIYEKYGGAEFLSGRADVKTTPLSKVSVANNINKKLDVIRLLNRATGNNERFEVVISNKDNEATIESSNQKTLDTLECDDLAYSQLHLLTNVLMESVVN